MNRSERQGAIRRLVRRQAISTQSDLAAALHAAGHDVVQTTVSRDIRELGLVKVRDATGRLVYALPEDARPRDLAAGLRRVALSVESSGNLVLVATPYGFANALCEEIDRAGHPKILGTVAGENTILIVARENVRGSELRDELRAYLLEGAA
ncbi:MAG: arginine repressor [Thermoleophilaceae bacterium]|nr:arginine repressor [Thermoleophilaceae bacterium]